MGLVADWAEDFGSKSKQAATKIKSIYGQHGILRRFLPKHQKKKLRCYYALQRFGWFTHISTHELPANVPWSRACSFARASCERSLFMRAPLDSSAPSSCGVQTPRLVRHSLKRKQQRWNPWEAREAASASPGRFPIGSDLCFRKLSSNCTKQRCS